MTTISKSSYSRHGWRAILLVLLALILAPLAACGVDDDPAADTEDVEGSDDDDSEGDDASDADSEEGLDIEEDEPEEEDTVPVDCSTRNTCESLGSVCDGAVVVSCVQDEDGCFVLEEEFCTGMTRMACNDEGERVSRTPRCIEDDEGARCAPIDSPAPCEEHETCIDGGDRDARCFDLCQNLNLCDDDAPAVSCDGDLKVTCEYDHNGCYVKSSMNCRNSQDPEHQRRGTCEGSTAVNDAPTCVQDGDEEPSCEMVQRSFECEYPLYCESTETVASCIDPCQGLFLCDPEDSMLPQCSYSGLSITTCEANADGCFVRETKACEHPTFMCDGQPGDAYCYDPCEGLDLCDDDEPDSLCDGEGTLFTCEPNSDGCRVRGVVSCVGEESCTEVSEDVFMCFDPCAGLELCDEEEAEAYCDDGRAITCELNEDGCYFRTVDDCHAAGDLCEYSEDGFEPAQAGCNSSCPEALPLLCGVAETASLAADAVTAPDSLFPCAEISDATSRGLIIGRLPMAVDGKIDLVISPPADHPDPDTLSWVLAVVQKPTGMACDDLSEVDESQCVSSEVTVNPVTGAHRIIFPAANGEEYLIYLTTNDPEYPLPSDVEIMAECFAALCGNGIIEPGEQCDDSNAEDDDGCSATCQIESGYICEGSPSECILLDDEDDGHGGDDGDDDDNEFDGHGGDDGDDDDNEFDGHGEP